MKGIMNREGTGPDVKTTFDDIAEDFDRTRYKPWEECIDFARTISPGSIILDVGCGNGRNCILLAKEHRVIGLDISHKMLLLARRNVGNKGLDHNCDFVQSDVVEHPVKDSSADVVFYIATLHHIPTERGRLNSLRELKRTLRKGGRALISVWAFDQPRFQELLDEHLREKENFGDVSVDWKRKDGRTFKRFYHLFYGEELKELALKAGLTVVDHFKSNDNYYAVVEKNSKD
ncbi:MAG: methyltransferase domain-containing protein [Thermoplasmata archaeon]|nr:methyltransferase domain-containing protein [Thermoplasmata archaeon]